MASLIAHLLSYEIVSNYRARIAHRVTSGLLFAAVLQAVCTLSVSPVAAAKPAPPPPPPPVKFALQLAYAPVSVTVDDMNDQGELVGVYDSKWTNRMEACLVTGEQITSLESLVPAPEGWFYAHATGINNAGSIAGYMYRDTDTISSTKSKHGFVIHRPVDAAAYVMEVPDADLGSPWTADINEDGILLVHTLDLDSSLRKGYVLDTHSAAPTLTELPLLVSSFGGMNSSIPAQIWGKGSDSRPFIYTLGDEAPEALGFESIGAINDLGAFCGSVTPKRSSTIAYRVSSTGTYQTFAEAKGGANEINENGDMIFGSTNTGTSVQLYTEGIGTLNLGSLLVGEADDIALFRNYSVRVMGMTERGRLNPSVPGFAGVGGWIYGPNGGVPFTLVPVAP